MRVIAIVILRAQHTLSMFWCRACISMALCSACSLLMAQPQSGSKPVDFGSCIRPSEDILKFIYLDRQTLRPVFPTRLVMELEACSTRSPDGPLAKVRRDIKVHDYVIRQVDSQMIPKNEQTKESFRECEQSRCAVEMYVKAGRTLSESTAKTGGFLFAGLMGHAGDEGHFEITNRAMLSAAKALNTKWTKALIVLIADASGDPDFSDWSTPAAHAQTNNDPLTGRINQSQAEARMAFKKWVVAGLERSIAACRSGNAGDAMYLLGYTIHAVQDMAFHEGMTNAEHSFNDFVENKPVDANSGEFYSQKMELAEAGSTRLLVNYFSYLKAKAPNCWTAVTRFEGKEPNSSRKLKLVRKSKKDFSLLALWEYRALSRKVRDAFRAGEINSFYLVEPQWLSGRSKEKMSAAVDQFVKISLPR